MTTYVPSTLIQKDTRPFQLDEVPSRPDHSTVLLVRPRYFDVRYRINPYMGGRVDADRAREQWRTLKAAYETHADSVAVLDPAETWATLEREAERDPVDSSDGTAVAPDRLPDMVFCANHGVATPDGTGVVLAEMATAERAGEPAHFAAWCDERGYEVLEAPDCRFEGTGDAIWHPGKRLLWGGYGVRTDREAYDELADRLETTVLTLELTDDHYYHLDVCFAPLGESTVLIQPEAFTGDGLATIRSVFERVLEVPREESRDGLAGNCHCVDGDTVLLGAGNPETERVLSDAGYEPMAIPTDEFQKAGGSVCCLKLELGSVA
ncbi:dimethylarginine dimethylaminohydrolase family protein [Natronorubrum sp. DTA7]|uniref:dimethylarginine dimethylaminohydrolase family protein n=1 Tax=Natronorubrum sp. DTA7 TaxID=3447016 RepID=UPI003F82BF21